MGIGYCPGNLDYFRVCRKTITEFLNLQKETRIISEWIFLLIPDLRMIFPKPEGIMGANPDGEPFLVPIAIPLNAGPSILAMLIRLTQSLPGNMTSW